MNSLTRRQSTATGSMSHRDTPHAVAMPGTAATPGTAARATGTAARATRTAARATRTAADAIRRWAIYGAWGFALAMTSPVCVVGQDVPAESAAAGKPLFDGKTMDGWEGDDQWFRIESGAIVAGSLDKEIPHNQFLCTVDEFGDFELTLEIRLIGEGRNAGVQFRSQRVPDSSEVSGYQADAGMAWDRPVWGGIYDESRRRKMLVMPDADALDGKINRDDWNRMRVVARGPSIQVYINDHPTADYTETDDSIPRVGKIGLQIHSGAPSEAWYRNVRIRSLEPQSP